MKKTKTYDYDPVDFIETDEKGLTRIAKEAGMTRQGLRKALSEDGNPGMTTFINILKVLGMQLTVAQV